MPPPPPDLAPRASMTQFAIRTPVQGSCSCPPPRRPALFTPSIFFESPPTGAAAVPVSPMMQESQSQTAAAVTATDGGGGGGAQPICDGLLGSLLDRFIRCGASSPDMQQQPDLTARRHTSPSPTASPSAPMLSAAVPPVDDAASAAHQQGSSCHQCKSRRQLSELSFCNNVTRKRSPQQQSPPSGEQQDAARTHCCRKKYCDVCLKKFYGEERGGPDHSSASSWPCPSCRLICTCAACRRQKLKARNIPERFLNSWSPATAVACSIVYFGNELGELLVPDALRLAAPQQQAAGRSSSSPVRTISFRSEVVQASVAEGTTKRVTKKPPQKRLKMDESPVQQQDEVDAESERVEKEATAEAAILLASLRTIVPSTISAS